MPEASMLDAPARPVTGAAATTGRRRRRPEDRAAYLFLGPWFLGVLLLTGGPILASLALSFTDFDMLRAPRWVGVGNYRQLTSDPHYARARKVRSDKGTAWSPWGTGSGWVW